MRNRLTLALSAVLVAAVFPAATAQFGAPDLVIRESATPNIKILHADGTVHDGLRCGVKARSQAQHDAVERRLRQYEGRQGFV